MPYYGTDFVNQATSESKLLSLDFAKLLATGETVNATPAWAIAVVYGTDANPTPHLSGAATLAGTIAKQRVVGLLANVKYVLTVTATTSLGNTLVLYSFISGTDGASTLIVETGAIIANSNSYNSLLDIRQFAGNRKRSLPGDDKELEGMAYVAMDYLEAYRNRFKGFKTVDTQSLQWPRQYVIIDAKFIYIYYSTEFVFNGFENLTPFPNMMFLDANTIPPLLKAAQCQLVLEQASGINIFPTQQVLNVIKVQKIGPIETTFDANQSLLEMPAVNAWLDPLLANAATLRTTRL